MKRFRPGASFGDFIVQDSSVSKRKVSEEQPSDFRRGWLVWVLVSCAMMFILVRLVSLQIFNGGKYRILSDENRIKRIKLIAPRGRILDRNGKELAVDVKQEKGVMQNENSLMFWKRQYPDGLYDAHVVGYLGEVTEDEVGLLKDRGEKYVVGELTGRGGIEAEYEKVLRGQDGGELVEVDNQGEPVRLLGIAQPMPGLDLKLTLDARLQKKAYEALSEDNKKGAVVVSTPETGELLSLVSVPSYDPSTLSIHYTELSNRTDLPLFDRAIGGVYPPGSTFKMVTTTAALESGKVKPGFTYTDTGIIRVGTFSYSNWLYSKNGGTEGNLGFTRAITRSTDTFFYQVGQDTGPEEIARWAKMFGFGEKTGIDISGEVAGLIPDPEWKERVKGEPWFLGDSFIMAIGQGDILTTPLQVNQMTNVLATGGRKCRPHLVGQLQPGAKEEDCKKLDISNQTLEIIKKGMVGACSPGGTAFPLFDWNEAAAKSATRSAYANRGDKPLPTIACKTGTAEYVAEDGKTRTHGWLTAYAPADDPQISVTAVVEGGGEGSNVAAPIVRKVMAEYFGVTDTYPYGQIHQVSE